MHNKKELQAREQKALTNSIMSMRDSLLDLSYAMGELLLELDSTTNQHSKVMVDEIFHKLRQDK